MSRKSSKTTLMLRELGKQREKNLKKLEEI